jgi:hypothetical protein
MSCHRLFVIRAVGRYCNEILWVVEHYVLHHLVVMCDFPSLSVGSIVPLGLSNRTIANLNDPAVHGPLHYALFPTCPFIRHVSH